MTEIFLRFRDLKARGIVNNWPTLKRWVAVLGFPSGRYLGSARVWLESEVEDWIKSRPTKCTLTDKQRAALTANAARARTAKAQADAEAA